MLVLTTFLKRVNKGLVWQKLSKKVMDRPDCSSTWPFWWQPVMSLSLLLKSSRLEDREELARMRKQGEKGMENKKQRKTRDSKWSLWETRQVIEVVVVIRDKHAQGLTMWCLCFEGSLAQPSGPSVPAQCSVLVFLKNEFILDQANFVMQNRMR